MTHDDPHSYPAGPGEEEVRRLLASLGSRPVPMPPDVAARLDATLADLAAQPSTAEADAAGTTTGPGVQPPPARTRRWPQLLVAAAAVSVLGLGVGEVLEDSGTGSDASSAVTAEREDAVGGSAGALDESAEEAAPYAASEDDAGPEVRPEENRRPEVDGEAALGLAPPALTRLRTDSLTSDVQRLADFSLTEPTAEQVAPGAGRVDACRLPETGAGDTLYAVRLDGRPATLLLHRPSAGERLAEVFECRGSAVPVASTVVQAR